MLHSLVDLFLYKVLKLKPKPSYNIFNVIERNLGTSLEMDWLILQCFDSILQTLSHNVINYKDEFPFDDNNMLVKLGYDYTWPFFICSIFLLFLSWLIPYV